MTTPPPPPPILVNLLEIQHLSTFDLSLVKAADNQNQITRSNVSISPRAIERLTKEKQSVNSFSTLCHPSGLQVLSQPDLTQLEITGDPTSTNLNALSHLPQDDMYLVPKRGVPFAIFSHFPSLPAPSLHKIIQDHDASRSRWLYQWICGDLGVLPGSGGWVLSALASVSEKCRSGIYVEQERNNLRR